MKLFDKMYAFRQTSKGSGTYARFEIDKLMEDAAFAIREHIRTNHREPEILFNIKIEVVK